ncbi:hypothetical protein V5O48_016214 [Marasmius crinis-equi]|uniref:F-box domain-containing protein n=1 Tax=Marasmius crinis-equi TaxID=585013 RepID=A0ABR3ESD0_9AGAR
MDYVPSDEEVLQTIACLGEEECELELYRKEIAERRRELKIMERREKALRDNVARRRSVISAQRKFPVEIWQIIFSMVCLASDYSLEINNEDDSFPPPPVTKLPVTLSHVCTRWRDIADSSPGLWSTISVTFHNLRPMNVALLERFLINSGNHSLRVRIKRPAGSLLLGNDERALKMVASQFLRAEHLVVDMEGFGLDRPITFPNLTMYKEEGTILIADSHWRQALRGAPSLRIATIIRLFSSSSLPYQQLSTLNIVNIRPTDLQLLSRILPTCQKLESLSIGCNILLQEGATIDLAPVELRSLRTLVIHDHITWKLDLTTTFLQRVLAMDTPMLTSLLASLRTPALETIELQCGDWEQSRQWPSALIGLLQRSSKTLSKISLRVAACTDAVNKSRTLSALLSEVPNLTCLGLDLAWFGRIGGGMRDYGCDTDWSDWLISELFSKLGNTEEYPDLAPNLTTVSFRMSDVVFCESEVHHSDMFYRKHDVLRKVLGAAAKRSPTSIARQSPPVGLRRPLTDIRVVRILCSDVGWPPVKEGLVPRPVALDHLSLGEIESIGEAGVRIAVEEVGEIVEW